MQLEHFSDASIHEPEVRALLRRVRSMPYPEATRDTADPIGAELRVTLKDGRVLTKKVRQARGRGSADPLPADVLEAKFLDCSSRALPETTGRLLLEMLHGLEGLDTVRSITEAMQASRTA